MKGKPVYLPLILVAVLTLSAHTLSAQVFGLESEDPELAAFVQRVDSIVPELLHEFLTPGAAVALLRDGHAAWGRGYGFADVASQEPITPQTAFNVGSISTTVTAWGVMRLVENGTLKLDAPIGQYLTRWQLPPSDFDARGVTMRRLLSHTAGLSLQGYPGFHPDERLPTIEQSLSGATNGSGAVRLIAEPGTQWRYSGGGYTLGQLVVEEVAGRRFADYMRESVLRPLGMQVSDYDWTSEIDELAAVPYNRVGEPIAGPRFTAAAAAGLQTNLEDFVAFAAANVPGYKTSCDAPCLLRPQTVAEMQSPAPASQNYGLGYAITTHNDIVFVGQTGATRGWRANFQVVPATGDGIVVMTNGSNGMFVHGPLVCYWRQWVAGPDPRQPCLKSVAGAVLRVVLEDGVDAAVERYHYLRRTSPEDYAYGEFQLNAAGYQLLIEGMVDEAIEIFQLNTWVFPDAWNTYDSLAEAYYVAGNVEAAVANYERSLELNPTNENAFEMLSRIKAGLPHPGFEEEF